MKRRELLLASALAAAGCATTRQPHESLEQLLYRYGDRGFKQVLDRRAEYGLQIILTRLERPFGEPRLETQTLYGSADRWFWPASLIKLPLAALALERLEAMRWPPSARLAFSARPVCVGEPEPMPQSAGDDVSRLIERALIVSDNFASNQLYDFLGAEEINRRLAELGYQSARIVGRLAFCTPQQQRQAPAYQVQDRAGAVLSSVPERIDAGRRSPPLGPILRGRGYIENGQLIEKPRDFSNGNFLALSDVHQMLIALLAPQWVQPAQRFALSKQALRFLKRTLGTLPREAGFDEETYPDNWAKFLCIGDRPGRISSGLKIHNKIGQAFGYLSDVAHIQTFDRELFLSASIYVNANGIYNDDRYEYDEIGFKFLGQLGRILSAHA